MMIEMDSFTFSACILYIHDLCSARGVLGKRALFVRDELIYMLIHWHVDLLHSLHSGLFTY